MAAPGWDHALKDPSPGAAALPPARACRVALVEGLYLLLELSPWREAVTPWFALRTLLRCPLDECRRRGARRNWAAGICATLPASEARWDENDTPNSELLLQNLDTARLDFDLSQEDAAAVAEAACKAAETAASEETACDDTAAEGAAV